MNEPILLAAVALGLGLASAWATAALRRWALRRSVLDIPNDRSSHTVPTPRGGGLVLVAALALVAPISWLAGAPLSSGVRWFLAGALLIAAVSWIEDLKTVPRALRFAAHAAAAALALWGLGAWDVVELPLFSVRLAWIGVPATFLWLVGLTNAYNFMDGIDAIAGLQAVAAAFGWIVVGGLTGQEQLLIVAVPLLACTAGFLVHNWPPASIFMGDVGSTLLGFTFAALPLMAGPSDPRLAFVGLLFVWPFVFDASFTFLRRLLRRENVFSPHRSHLYQRLILCGRSHRSVSLLYFALAAASVGAACSWVAGMAWSGTLVWLVPIALATGLIVDVRLAEGRRGARSAGQ